MPLDSSIQPEDTSALAAAASQMIDAVLDARGAIGREAFWATIRKAYNTPYNDPPPKARPAPAPEAPAPQPMPAEIAAVLPLPELAALSLAGSADAHAA
ncbi:MULTISPECIES: hypothetical protein [Methylobacterium]|uniref:Uncharacterized protein n=1 Tax=Methylobacterium jeotgali TaxID=381630 RepID=A0ABQ4SX09_9HYPH|nr:MULTISPECIES: hypothetical protein [Methylobacterium]PIU05799.1 MAG: hypothetical protein COT56_12755 [Methylobacterium sp. CG09_land_8_20_14_0_10_71_15]PIU13934.1 MAG: hypothetical protein COT28_09305 [Methylobacterium sp. CG08_land_8_20_14_0_20_71_15]GBU17374.1 hypothetical protein AwMethylo_15890 [Methylobacterium sp.]GJE07697.1 hypothetical protein AOPFMNJM_3027 [Methylobacterium jeotgali]